MRPEDMTSLTDSLVRMAKALTGSQGSGHGAGCPELPIEQDWGFSRLARECHQGLLETHDWRVIQKLAYLTDGLVRAASNQGILRSILCPYLDGISRAAGSSGITGVTDLQTFVRYHNQGPGGPYSCLMHPGWPALFLALRRGKPWPPGTTWAPAGQIHVADASGDTKETDSADPAVHAGYLGVALSCCSVKSDRPYRVIVTGVGRTAEGEVLRGREWATDIIDPEQEVTQVPLVSQVPGDLLLTCTDLRIPPMVSAGSFCVMGVGR